MSTIVKFLFFLGDLIFLNVAIVISFELEASSVYQVSDKTYLLIFSNLAWLYLNLVSNPYSLNKGWAISKALRLQFAFIFIHLLVVASLIFFMKKSYSFFQIGFIYVLFMPFFFSLKIATYYLRKLFSADVLVKNFILIGQNEISHEIRRYYLSNPDLGYRFLGYINLGEAEVLLDKIREFEFLNEVHEIYCCAPELSSAALKPLIEFGLDSLIKVKLVTDSVATHQQTIQLDRFSIEPNTNIAVIALDESRNQFVKRAFDLFFSSLFLIAIMSWLLPIVAIIIKLDSKGPVFFRQLRSGEYNKPFWCFKFRTMVVNLDSDNKQATKNDSRITKLGSILRKTSIDELPQFINVFIGNMSVVGPRPHMLKHTEEYGKLIEKFMGRHYVKPGITGLAQCLGYRGETKDLIDMENRVTMDRYYIENWTFWLDIKIISLTVVSLIRGSDKAF
jgi:putative colanic acid biosysnthesis UDP-glucose lipid carrier transferase